MQTLHGDGEDFLHAGSFQKELIRLQKDTRAISQAFAVAGDCAHQQRNAHQNHKVQRIAEIHCLKGKTRVGKEKIEDQHAQHRGHDAPKPAGRQHSRDQYAEDEHGIDVDLLQVCHVEQQTGGGDGDQHQRTDQPVAQGTVHVGRMVQAHGVRLLLSGKMTCRGLFCLLCGENPP